MKTLKTNCIMCPLGCELTVKFKSAEDYEVSGNGCIRGVSYIKSEQTEPVRNISSLIRVVDGVVPVKTTKPIPKEKIGAVLEELKKINLKEPPKFGTVVINNVLNLGVDIVTIGF